MANKRVNIDSTSSASCSKKKRNTKTVTQTNRGKSLILFKRVLKKVSWAMKINFIVYAVMLYKLKHHETPKYS